jgi:hypothetical protein
MREVERKEVGDADEYHGVEESIQFTSSIASIQH